MVSQEYENGISEVLAILECSEPEYEEKIPKKLMKFLKENQSKTYKPEMISVNVKGTKTKYPKKNEYLQEFNYMYVIENLNDYIVKKGVE